MCGGVKGATTRGVCGGGGGRGLPLGGGVAGGAVSGGGGREVWMSLVSGGREWALSLLAS